VANGKVLPAAGEARSGASTIAIRPERLRLTDRGVLTGRIKASIFVSGQMIYRVVTEGGQELTVKESDAGAPRPPGTQVGVDWNPADVVVLSD
jgi:ABC-type Fe3+/spermidine/putrescine transport system ATPase subunit